MLKFVGSNAAEIELPFFSLDCNSNKFVLKFVGSNAAEIELLSLAWIATRIHSAGCGTAGRASERMRITLFPLIFGFLTLTDHCHLDPRLGRTTAPATMHGVPGACQWHDHGGMTGRGGQGYLSAALQGQAVFCSCPCAAPGGCAQKASSPMSPQ